jgi:hypothetical protein
LSEAAGPKRASAHSKKRTEWFKNQRLAASRKRKHKLRLERKETMQCIDCKDSKKACVWGLSEADGGEWEARQKQAARTGRGRLRVWVAHPPNKRGKKHI